MSIIFTYAPPFNSLITQAVQIDTATGDGTTTEFIQQNKSVSQVAGTIQYSTVQKTRRDGGFSVSSADNSVTIDTAPPAGTQIIFPGTIPCFGDFSAYDQDTVTGVSNPRVKEAYTYLVVTDPNVFDYIPRGTNPGIAISFVDNITGVGAELSWVQLSCCDYTGATLGYLATATTLYTPSMNAWGYIASGSWAGSSSILVDGASDFIIGDYVIINIGNSLQEEIRIQSKTNTTLTFTTTLNYAHASGEPVYTRARQFKGKLTVPSNATGGSAALLPDLSLNIVATRRQKV